MALLLALGGLAAVTVRTAPPAPAAPAGTVHLPDLQTIIPTSSFSIAGTGADREFRYTHLVYNGGEGPLAIQPFYRASAGVYLGRQQLMTHDAHGTWSVASQRRVADAFVFHAEHGHFHFPLASFGLYQVAADGGPGAPASMSPKVGFCISDSYIYNEGIDHAGVGAGMWGSCAEPTSLRGLSVGGADEYDYRDPGQSVPIPDLPDGTYWFRAISDPNNDILESDESNNEADVLVTIRGGSVTAGATTHPDTTPCTVTLRRPAEGTSSAGGVRLEATTSVGAPSRVQYYVDGLLSTTSGADASPYPASWNTAATADGVHWVSAKVTDRRGRVCTSRPVQVTVDNTHGHDGSGPRLSFTDPAAGSRVGGRVAIAVAAADASGVSRVRFAVDGRQIGVDRRPPYSIVWDSRGTKPGPHRLSARATDRAGHSSRAAIRIRVTAVPPPRHVSVDGSVVARGTGALTTPGLHTSRARDVVVAFVSYDGPDGADTQRATVTGGGLAWHLVKRSTTQPGDAEVWAARTDHALHGAAVRAVPAAGGYAGMLSVMAFRNAARIGVAGAAGAPRGAPSFYLPAIQEGSLVYAAGADWDNAVARVPVAHQVIRRQWVESGTGCTFWVQALDRPTTAQRLITIADSAPTADSWNYVGVEVVARR